MRLYFVLSFETFLVNLNLHELIVGAGLFVIKQNDRLTGNPRFSVFASDKHLLMVVLTLVLTPGCSSDITLETGIMAPLHLVF